MCVPWVRVVLLFVVERGLGKRGGGREEMGDLDVRRQAWKSEKEEGGRGGGKEGWKAGGRRREEGEMGSRFGVAWRHHLPARLGNVVASDESQLKDFKLTGALALRSQL
ncbi:hypothetical protein DFH07DRAFT_780480 [Mycena maculata]|uniref:Uncharacterized protein n=1 Tax=Mycena maculata TaxID=230809 RepID=A0AAD7MUS2_9AGAR|nr:hypothetical protein DFH07DRAFT_780480 [Mycena maculata]